MKILRILTRPNVGGPMRQAIALWHAHAAAGHTTVLVTGTCAADETELQSDLPSLAPHELAATQRGGHLVLPELGRRVGWLRDRRAGCAIERIVADFEPDVVHTHTSKAGWLGRRAAARRGVAVIAHTYHGIVLRDYFVGPLGWLLRGAERRLASITDLTFAVSESCRDELHEFRIDGVEVLPPAVGIEPPWPRDVARRMLGLPEAGCVVAFVGRLVPIKRAELFVDLLAEAMPITMPRRGDAPSDVLGVVLGDGPEFRRLSARSAGNRRLRWLGVRQDAPRLLAAFDAIVLPSKREGFPLIVVEATAAGVPSCGFDVPGVRDAIRASGQGALAREGSGVPGLRAALADALVGPSPDASLARAFDPSVIAARLIRCYERALAAKRT